MQEIATLSAVLDTLIPPSRERGLPGAGALGLAQHLRDAVPELSALVDPALAELDARARESDAAGFAALTLEARHAALCELSERQPALLPGLLFQTYRAYYSHPTVLSALGVPPRPPHPEGYEIGADDLSLLENVRSRRKLYRDA